MKKLLLIIISLFCVNVYAEGECSSQQIQKAMEDLKNITYTLNYIPNQVDKNGDPTEGYFNLSFSNIPDSYRIEIRVNEGVHSLTQKYTTVPLKGGVYKLKFYTKGCENSIMSSEIMIPFYKKYCSLNKKCENVWFDGTYINNNKNLEPKQPKTSILLIGLATVLVLISTITIFVFLKKRRHKNEVSF